MRQNILRTSTAAFLILAAVAIAQCLLYAALVTGQRDSSRVVNIGGAQRMRSQRIAYFLATAHYGHPEPGWRGDVESTIATILAVHRQVEIDADRGSPAARTRDRFIAAARVLEKHPDDTTTFAVIRTLRQPVLDGFDDIVKSRAALNVARNRLLVAALFAGLIVQLLTIAAVWMRLIVPAERRVGAALVSVLTQQSEILAQFEHDPDAIAVYDGDGHLVRANAARRELLGLSEAECIGRHFSDFLTTEGTERARSLFARANAGENVFDETQLVSVTGDVIDVAIKLFPNIVNGVASGVIVVSRDITELCKSRALNDQLAERFAALYAIVSAHDGEWKDQIADALTLAANQLDCEWGVVCEVADETVTVLSLVGEPLTRVATTSMPLKDSLSVVIIAADDVLEVDDLHDSAWLDDHVRHLTGWSSVIAMKLRVEGITYGTIALASAKPRSQPRGQADRDFLRIVAELLGTIINRGRQDLKLDSLAFFDGLTGLPNRASLDEKLAELIVSSRRRGDEFAVHFLDLDKFKHINDTAGHAVGDEVLRIAAKRFLHCVRSSDTVARLGGDEFVILAPGNGGRQGAVELADRITRAFAEPIMLDGVEYAVGCSIGTSLFPAEGDDAKTLLERADAAMYETKTRRRSRTGFAA